METLDICGGKDNKVLVSIPATNNWILLNNPEPYITISGTYDYKPRRLKCVYCDCISSKESGTCENCGAPLVEDEY